MRGGDSVAEHFGVCRGSRVDLFTLNLLLLVSLGLGIDAGPEVTFVYAAQVGFSGRPSRALSP